MNDWGVVWHEDATFVMARVELTSLSQLNETVCLFSHAVLPLLPSTINLVSAKAVR